MYRPIALLALAVALSACGAIPQSREAARPAKSQVEAPRQTSAGFSAPQARMCLASLDTAGARFDALPDRYYGAGCNTLDSVRIEGLAGDSGSILLANAGPIACPLAETLAGWARYGVDRAARQYLGSPLARIETMGSFSCRNVAGTQRLSAHSRAEAIDISAFILADGRRISVKDDWNGGDSAERAFLHAIHRSACKRFGTVLGPDYNAAHQDHIHVEGQGAAFCR